MKDDHDDRKDREVRKDSRASGPRTAMELGARRGHPDAKLGRDVQAKIGQQLRAIYDEVLNQGVPDRFHDLLSKLDQANTKQDKGGADGT
jgi:hypothetical protein